MKTKEQIEEMADNYKPNFPHEECLDRDDLEFIENEYEEQYISLDEVGRVAKACHRHTFQKAYAQAQQDLINEASEGFEGWPRLKTIGDTYDVHKAYRNGARDAWQAARLSMMKENESFKKEALEVMRIYASNSRWSHGKNELEPMFILIGNETDAKQFARAFLAKHSEEKGDGK